MEVNKVLGGFTVADTLVIKAQVQVIRLVSTTLCVDIIESIAHYPLCT